MFEGFSFPSPSPRGGSPVAPGPDDEMMLEADSSLISPLSSRCPSPVLRSRSPKDHPLFSKRSRSQFRQAPPPPTSIPRGYTDGHRLSIGTLTRKLQIQSLEADTSSDSDDGRFPLTPPRSAHAETPSIFLDSEPLISPSTGPGEDQTWPLLSPRSVPEDFHPRSSSLPVPAHLLPRRPSSQSCAPNNMREQRETLSVLQSASNNSVSETVRLAYLMEDAGCLSFNELDEDQHPSSLPPSPISLSRKRALLNQSSSRRQSTTGGNNNKAGDSSSRSRLGSTSAARVSKNQSSNANSSDRTAHAIRRRSLVLAAVAAMVDGEISDRETEQLRRSTSRESSLSLSSREIHVPRSQPGRGGSPQP